MAAVVNPREPHAADELGTLLGQLLDVQHDLAEATVWLADHWPAGVPAPEFDESLLRSQGVAVRLWASVWDVEHFARLVDVCQCRPLPLERHPQYVTVTRRFGSVLIEAWFDTDRWELALGQTPTGDGGDQA